MDVAKVQRLAVCSTRFSIRGNSMRARWGHAPELGISRGPSEARDDDFRRRTKRAEAADRAAAQEAEYAAAIGAFPSLFS